MVTQTKVQVPTLNLLISRFASRPHLTPKTCSYYAMVLRHFAWYARLQSWPALDEITREHLRDFLTYVANEEYRWPESPRSHYKKASTATVHHYGTVIKSFFNWAEDEEYLINNPALRMRLGRPGYREVEPYSDDEVYAMLKICSDDARLRYRYLGTRNQAIISLFVSTGLRLSELAGINMAGFDPALQQLTVLGKGRKMRVVPISGEARKALRGYLRIRPEGSEALWISDEGNPLSPYSIQIMIARLKRRAGINGGGGPHRFRHYFATKYLEAGGDLNSLRLLLGHATLAMSIKYSRFVDIKKVLATHQQFNPLDHLYRGRGGSHDGRTWGL